MPHGDSTAPSRASEEGGSEPPARRGRSRAARLPYAVATLLLGFMVLAAWIARDRFHPVVAGESAPDYTVEDLQGRRVALSDYAGKVLLVNIWATWCLPCREEMPSMERLYREIGSEDFQVLAVSVDQDLGGQDGSGGASLGKLADFAHEYDLTFTILHDPSGLIQTIYQTTGVPESFIIDRDGVIRRRLAGQTVWDHDRYRELIRGLLDG